MPDRFRRHRRERLRQSSGRVENDHHAGRRLRRARRQQSDPEEPGMSNLIPPQIEPTGAARLEATGMSKRFGSLIALEDVSITVPAGSFHALLGENGAGKSTLVKSLIGFYKADQGTVLIDNRERE